MARPLSVCWTEVGSPLIQPAGPDCGFMIQAVMTAAAMLPMMIARICWSLKKFFMAGPPLAWAHGAPHNGDALCGRQVLKHLGRCQSENCASGVAFDHQRAGAGAIGCGVGQRDPLQALGDGEIGRDVAARSYPY